jgi:hypothetical protein
LREYFKTFYGVIDVYNGIFRLESVEDCLYVEKNDLYYDIVVGSHNLDCATFVLDKFIKNPKKNIKNAEVLKELAKEYSTFVENVKVQDETNFKFNAEDIFMNYLEKNPDFYDEIPDCFKTDKMKEKYGHLGEYGFFDVTNEIVSNETKKTDYYRSMKSLMREKIISLKKYGHPMYYWGKSMKLPGELNDSNVFKIEWNENMNNVSFSKENEQKSLEELESMGFKCQKFDKDWRGQLKRYVFMMPLEDFMSATMIPELEKLIYDDIFFYNFLKEELKLDIKEIDVKYGHMGNDYGFFDNVKENRLNELVNESYKFFDETDLGHLKKKFADLVYEKIVIESGLESNLSKKSDIRIRPNYQSGGRSYDECFWQSHDDHETHQKWYHTGEISYYFVFDTPNIVTAEEKHDELAEIWRNIDKNFLPKTRESDFSRAYDKSGCSCSVFFKFKDIVNYLFDDIIEMNEDLIVKIPAFWISASSDEKIHVYPYMINGKHVRSDDYYYDVLCKVLEKKPHLYEQIVYKDDRIKKEWDHLSGEFGFFDTVNESSEEEFVNEFKKYLREKYFEKYLYRFEKDWILNPGNDYINILIYTIKLSFKENGKIIFDPKSIEKEYNDVFHQITTTYDKISCEIRLNMNKEINEFLEEKPHFYEYIWKQYKTSELEQKYGHLGEYGFFDTVNEEFIVLWQRGVPTHIADFLKKKYPNLDVDYTANIFYSKEDECFRIYLKLRQFLMKII